MFSTTKKSLEENETSLTEINKQESLKKKSESSEKRNNNNKRKIKEQ